MKMRLMVIAALLAGWPTPSSAQVPARLQPSHLGARCTEQVSVAGPWRVVYEALATPGDPAMDGELAAVQDSVTDVLDGNPDALGARFLLATVLGARSEVSGGSAKLEWAAAMEVETREILDREPEHPGARHLMGRLHAAVRRMSGVKRFLARTLFGGDILDRGSWETARAHLEAAEATAPCVPDHHYELARLYLDLGLTAEAAREVRHTLELAGVREEFRHLERKALELLGEGPSPQRP